MRSSYFTLHHSDYAARACVLHYTTLNFFFIQALPWAEFEEDESFLFKSGTSFLEYFEQYTRIIHFAKHLKNRSRNKNWKIYCPYKGMHSSYFSLNRSDHSCMSLYPSLYHCIKTRLNSWQIRFSHINPVYFVLVTKPAILL